MAISVFVIPLTWITMAPPFVVARVSFGFRCVRSAPKAALAGCITGLATVPFAVFTAHILDIAGLSDPYLVDVGHEYGRGLLYAAAGAIGGVTYWVVEVSSLPVDIISLVRDGRALPGTRGLLSRRVAALIGVAAVVLVGVPLAQWWWRPHVHRGRSAALPPVSFEREWATRDYVGALTWSQDGERLTSLSGNGDWLLEHPLDGRDAVEHQVVKLDTLHVAASDRVLVGKTDSDETGTLNVIDAATGSLLHQERGVVPRDRFNWMMAFSHDGTRLAIGDDDPQQHLRVRIYGTQDWCLLSTFDLGPERVRVVQAMAFSRDDGLIAVAGGNLLRVIDVRTVTVLHKWQAWPGAVAFSPDGAYLAIADQQIFASSGPPSDVLRVLRLSDGIQVATRQVGTGGSQVQLLWDPRGRFIAWAAGDLVRLWPALASSSADVTTIDLRSMNKGLVLSPDGTRLAVANGSHISVFRIGPATPSADRATSMADVRRSP